MGAERLGAHVAKRGLFHRHVTGSAAVDYAKFRYPSLLHASLETALERDRIAPAAYQPQVALLIEIPLAKLISRGNDGEREQ
jgi:hypothetical protein